VCVTCAKTNHLTHHMRNSIQEPANNLTDCESDACLFKVVAADSIMILMTSKAQHLDLVALMYAIISFGVAAPPLTERFACECSFVGRYFSLLSRMRVFP
jgi:hypothetical protein